MNEFYYKLCCSYQGTFYSGLQIQNQGEKTIQGELHKVLEKIVHSDNFRTLSSGRTDAGVHALNQIFKVSLPIEIEPDSFKKALNSLLPWDIIIKSVERSSKEFHPIGDSDWKEYVYLFSGEKKLPPHMYPFIGESPRKLDFELMSQGLNLFLGEHDFKNYRCVGTNVKSTIRTIMEVSLIKSPKSFNFLNNEDGNFHMIKIKGNGFLKQMVRLMVGTIWAVGNKKVSLDQLEHSLKGIDEIKLGATAPAKGLYLNQVFYP